MAMGKQETIEYLHAHGVSFEITEHKAVYNMEELSDVVLPYPEADAKNLFVRDDKKRKYYLLTVPGDKRVDLKEFRRQQGTRSLSFASDDDLARYLGLFPGAVTPLGALNDETRSVKVFLDRAFAGGLIGVHPNDNTATLWLKTEDLVRVLQEHGTEVLVTDI
mgnify:FL=1